MGIFSTGMSQELKDFLEAEDLDDLLEARSKIRQLDEKDIKKILSVLQRWNNHQAVSNLLFHPHLIPENMRATCLIKGLREKKNPYYILASVVGLQGIDPTGFSKEQRKAIKECLISALNVSEGIISARASVTIYDYLSLEDASAAFELLSHPNEAARHNILCWLIRTMEESGPRTFISTANSSNIPEGVRKEAIEKFQEHLRQKEIGECSLFGTQLYAYIPNLKEDVNSLLNLSCPSPVSGGRCPFRSLFSLKRTNL